ncbi:nucleoside hydrolase [Salinispira pacifica]
MQRLLIDTDPGHDDAIAIFLALAYPEHCELGGITTVAGNQTLDKVTDNALKLLSFVGRPIPVARGAAAPLERPLATASAVHGESGLGGVELPKARYQPVPEPAVDFARRFLAASDEPATIVSIGPQTNLALLLRAFPEAKQRIGLVSFMGGGISHGNRTMTAEFNIYTDPEAAREVIGSGVSLVMSGLDVTEKAYIEEREIDSLKRRGPVSRLVAELLGFYAEVYRSRGLSSPALHDPCSIAYLIRPELFEAEDMYIDVETTGELTRGMTVADRRPGRSIDPNVRVLLDVDRHEFVELLFEGLGRLDREVEESGRNA